jgi:lysophospholipase L1-like esterase
MRKESFVIVLALLAGVSAAAQPAGNGPAPARIILVGDSTTAPRNGWGPGFCANNVTPQVTCLNLAKNGRSSSSYRAEGSWARVMSELKSNSAFAATYVLIQFGHNDQPGKPGRSTDLATEFPANMRQYVKDLKAAGARPVLVTPLTRRIFKDGKLTNDLVPWADATRKVAAEEGVPVLELNSDSAAAVQKMGPSEANTLAMAPPPEAVTAGAASGNSPSAPRAPRPPVPAPAGARANNAVEPPGNPAPVFDYTIWVKRARRCLGAWSPASSSGPCPNCVPTSSRDAAPQPRSRHGYQKCVAITLGGPGAPPTIAATMTTWIFLRYQFDGA